MPNVFTHPAYDDHEQVIFVLRLSRGMTMKNAAAGLPLGGGKCVIIADPQAAGKEARVRAMAKHVQRLAGTFWTAIDVGVSAQDADLMAQDCDYIFARASHFEADFPPAHFTALGGFQGIRAAAQHLRASTDLRGMRVAVQGTGATGADLISQLVASGVEIVAADVNDASIDAVASEFGVRKVSPEEIHCQPVDIFAPCALGGILNDKTIPQLQCAAVVGLANNQLERPENGQQLLDRSIAYAPDFIVNAGGVMGASMPIFTTPNKEESLKRVAGIYDATLEILTRSKAQQVPTEVIAEALAMQDSFQNAFTATIRRVVKLGQGHYPLTQLGKPYLSRIDVWFRIGQLNRDFQRICPLHSVTT